MAGHPQRSDIAQVVRGYNAKPDQITSLRLLGKIYQHKHYSYLCSQKTDAEKDIESFYASVQKEADTLQQNALIILGGLEHKQKKKVESNIVEELGQGVRNAQESDSLYFWQPRTY